jgi:hypothetical protein
MCCVVLCCVDDTDPFQVLLPSAEGSNDHISKSVRGMLQARVHEDIPLDATEARMLEQVFAFAAIWAFGSALSTVDGEDMRKRFSDHWRSLPYGARLPSRDTVFDYCLLSDTDKFEPWKNSPYFTTIIYESSTPMSQVTVPTPETCSIMFWLEVRSHRSQFQLTFLSAFVVSLATSVSRLLCCCCCLFP